MQILKKLNKIVNHYLLRKPETNVLMTKMLQVLDKQKAAKYMTIDQRSVIDGALAYVRPDPDSEVSVKRKERSVVEQFIRHLVYVELDTYNSNAVLLELRRLDWNDEETYRVLTKVFCKIHKVRTANVNTMAVFLKTLKKFYQSTFNTFQSRVNNQSNKTGIKLF